MCVRMPVWQLASELDTLPVLLSWSCFPKHFKTVFFFYSLNLSFSHFSPKALFVALITFLSVSSVTAWLYPATITGSVSCVTCILLCVLQTGPTSPCAALCTKRSSEADFFDVKNHSSCRQWEVWVFWNCLFWDIAVFYLVFFSWQFWFSSNFSSLNKSGNILVICYLLTPSCSLCPTYNRQDFFPCLFIISEGSHWQKPKENHLDCLKKLWTWNLWWLYWTYWRRPNSRSFSLL